MQQPGQNTFDVRIGQCTLDYPTLERLYGYKRADIDSKITPYVMLRNGADLSSSVKSSVCRFNQVNNYNFDTVLRTWASPTDKVYLYLVDDNLITRDTYLGYCLLPLASTGAPIGSFQNIELLGMDPKHNRTASIPTADTASFGRIGMIQVACAPVDLSANPIASTGIPGKASLTSVAGVQSHIKEMAPAAAVGALGVGGMGALAAHQMGTGRDASTLGTTGTGSNVGMTQAPLSSGSQLPATGSQYSGTQIPASSSLPSGASSSLQSAPPSATGTYERSTISDTQYKQSAPLPVTSGTAPTSGTSGIPGFDQRVDQSLAGSKFMTTAGTVQSTSDTGVLGSTGGSTTQSFVDSGTVIGQGQNPDSVHRI
jgi:hypothetical protein